MTIPPYPEDTPSVQGRMHLRFEDVSQDGRLVFAALPNALESVWRSLLASDPATRFYIPQGIKPILSRYILEGRPGPFSAKEPLQAEGASCLARVDDGRLVLGIWADLTGIMGRTVSPTDRADKPVLAGRVFAEYVLTRPSAPEGQRRVTSLDFPGAPRITATRPAPAYDEIASVPVGATPLEPRMGADSVPIVFGLVHTDSNNHVNSLVYLRLFEEAALRRFASLGHSTRVLGSTLDIVYRKPCFAGQTMRVVQQAFEEGARLGVASALVEEREVVGHELAPGIRPHSYARITFET